MTLSITTLGIRIENAECRVFMLNVIMLSVVMLSVIMLNVIMLRVVAPSRYAELSRLLLPYCIRTEITLSLYIFPLHFYFFDDEPHEFREKEHLF
jgi:hypothetical protein